MYSGSSACSRRPSTLSSPSTGLMYGLTFQRIESFGSFFPVLRALNSRGKDSSAAVIRQTLIASSSSATEMGSVDFGSSRNDSATSRLRWARSFRQRDMSFDTEGHEDFGAGTEVREDIGAGTGELGVTLS